MLFISAFDFPRISSQEHAVLPPLWEVLLHVSDNEDVAAVVSMILEPKQFLQPQDDDNVIGSGEDTAIGGLSRSGRERDLYIDSGYFEERSERPKENEASLKSEEEDDRPAWGETPLVGEANSGEIRIRVNHEKIQREGQETFQGEEEISRRMSHAPDEHSKISEEALNRKREEEIDERPAWGETPVVNNEDSAQNRIRVDIPRVEENHENVQDGEGEIARKIDEGSEITRRINQVSIQSRTEERISDTLKTKQEEDIDDRPAWGETPLVVMKQ